MGITLNGVQDVVCTIFSLGSVLSCQRAGNVGWRI